MKARRRYALRWWVSIILVGVAAIWAWERLCDAVPAGESVELPRDAGQLDNPAAHDPQGEQLIQSFRIAQPEQLMPVNLRCLGEFSGPNRALLLRHLATSAKWYLSRYCGKLFAARRYVLGGRWEHRNNSLSYVDFNPFITPHFGFSIVIGPDGHVMDGSVREKATYIRATDATVRLIGRQDKEFGQGYQSYLVVQSNAASLELFEQSDFEQRRLSGLALSQLRDEFRSVLNSPTVQQRGFDLALMPAESMKRGKSELHLVNWFQDGMYQIVGYLNPGESGYVFLKIFRAAGWSDISYAEMKTDSIEYIGWSDDPNEQFYYNAGLTMDLDTLRDALPARFEIWFAPDSGKPERLLLQKFFRIHQWSR